MKLSRTLEYQSVTTSHLKQKKMRTVRLFNGPGRAIQTQDTPPSTAYSNFSPVNTSKLHDWEYRHPSYDLLADYESRLKDIHDFPNHYGYAVDKRIGWDSLNLDLVAGVFSGIVGSSNNSQKCEINNLKSIMRVRGVLGAMGHTVQLIDAEIVQERIEPGFKKRQEEEDQDQEAQEEEYGDMQDEENQEPDTVDTASEESNRYMAKAKASIAGKVVYDKEFDWDCEERDVDLYQGTMLLLSFDYVIPVYVAKVKIGMDIHGKYDLDLRYKACIVSHL